MIFCMKILIVCALFASISCQHKSKYELRNPSAACLIGGRPAAVSVNEQAFCAHQESASDKDFQVVKNRIKALDEQFKDYQDGDECEGAVCSLFSGAKEKFKLSQTMNEYKSLNRDEVFTILNYAEWGYQAYNSVLWSEKSESEATVSEIKVLATALRKIKPYSAEKLYRGEIQPHVKEEYEALEQRVSAFNLEGASLEEPKAGREIFYQSFMSTTIGSNEEAKEAYIDGRMISIEVKGQSGRLIAPLSSREWEEEVLFLPGTWFKVEDIQKVKRKPTANYPYGFQWKIKLSEIVDSRK